MDLWPAYMQEARKGTFGTSALQLRTGKRWHTSLAMVGDRSRELGLNTAFVQKYSEESRYIIARDITHDLFMSVYDVDTETAIVLRPTLPLNGAELKRVIDVVRKKRLKNLEVRAIGLHASDQILQGCITKLHSGLKDARLMEADLFGNAIRHLAMDLKTGSVYDLLLQNRVYGPADLIDNADMREFESKRSQLTFV